MYVNCSDTCLDLYVLYICCTQSIVRESAKAANLWERTPLMKDITETQWKDFYETVYTRGTYMYRQSC